LEKLEVLVHALWRIVAEVASPAFCTVYLPILPIFKTVKATHLSVFSWKVLLLTWWCEGMT
jgi:hypothetical protein